MRWQEIAAAATALVGIGTSMVLDPVTTTGT